MAENGYVARELVAMVLARDLEDGEVISGGVAGPVPFAAMRLAQETHAPNLTLVYEGGMNPRPPILVDDPVDPMAHKNVESISDMVEVFINTERGWGFRGIDAWFMSGLQTDQFGNLNVHWVGGSRERPAMRGPGIGNAGLASTSARWYNYPSVHDKRHFVPRVDFITALGNEGGVARRRERGVNYGAGCKLVVSPLAVMDFDEETGRMRLKSVHPGHTVAEVVDATGFELLYERGSVPFTAPPTKDELEILRRVVDPTGLLRTL